MHEEVEQTLDKIDEKGVEVADNTQFVLGILIAMVVAMCLMAKLLKGGK